MSTQDKIFVTLLITFFCVGFLVGGLVGGLGRDAEWRKDMAKRGFAHYDTRSGEWLWNNEAPAEAKP